MKRDLRDSELYEASYRFKEKRANARFYAFLCVVLLFILGFRYYWVSNFGGVEVDGASMKMTLQNKEQLLVRYTQNGEGLQRGDVIVVHVEDYPEIQYHNQNRPESAKVKYLIKRLIAIEGDVVKCEAGQVYIQYGGEGEFVPIVEEYAYYDSAKENYSFAEYTVGEGEIFFLGDNRNNSLDSRYKEGNSHLPNRLYKASDVFGVVPTWAIEWKSVIGKIFF